MSASQPPNGVLAWAARLGPLWYGIPSLIVILVGVATCNLIDVPEYDDFEVVRTLAMPGNARFAVVTRQKHFDSGSTVSCVFLVAGSAPSLGPTPRLGPACALVATDVATPLEIRWLPGGKLGIRLPAGVEASASEPLDQRCYFHNDVQRICYRPQLVAIDAPVH